MSEENIDISFTASAGQEAPCEIELQAVCSQQDSCTSRLSQYVRSLSSKSKETESSGPAAAREQKKE